MSWFVVIWAGAVIVLCTTAVWVALSKTIITHAKAELHHIDVAALLVIAFGSILLLLAELDIWNVPDWLFVVLAVALALLLESAEQRRRKGVQSRGWNRIVPWLFVAYLVINMLLQK